MTKPYRIRHKASGLYYQPAINHSNLSKNGKVYMTNNSLLMLNNSYDYIAISVRKGTKVHDILEKEMPLKGVESFYGKAVCYRVPKSEFEKEELQRMKRNIKFKAKRLDNGEWVKGDLVHSTSYVGISYSSNEFSDVPIVHRVDPETVCQFTGLKDYENQDIYEGDILAEKRYPEFEVGYINCTFAAAYVGDDKFIFNLTALSEVCTVCGNKFDRKEGEK